MGQRGTRNSQTGLTERIHRLDFTVDWPPGHAAAYLIEGPEPILVDAGVPDERGTEELETGLAAHDYVPKDIAHLLLTHPHSDHIGQAATVVERADPVVYAPRPIRDRLRRSTDDLAAGVRRTARQSGFDGDQLDGAIEEAVDSLRRSRRLLPPDEIDVALGYDEPFTVAGHRFEAIHTPGHQAEHACFQVSTDGAELLFAGDVLIQPFRAGAINVGLDIGAYDAIIEYYAAYDRLSGRDVERVFPGHGPVFTDYEATIARSRDDLDDLLDSVAGTLESLSPATPLRLAQERASGGRLTHVLLDTIGALGCLDRCGRVAFDVEDGVRQYRCVDAERR
jgi:glyoxylase-like metal-dependent hydrolase (beta-lactamase superfamily II)